MIRANFYIDGFNLYHALKHDHYKWLDLMGMCAVFAPVPDYELQVVYYFTAHATWLPDSYRRHRQYIAALEATGVTPVLGKFKKKQRHCKKCLKSYDSHEEKESDVNLAITLVNDACEDKFDTAFLLTADSDFCPAVRMVLQKFPKKKVKIVTPKVLQKSYDLVGAAGGKQQYRQILPMHIEDHLLPRHIKDKHGNTAAIRPQEYDPPPKVTDPVAKYDGPT